MSLFCISENTEGENPEGNEQEEEDDEGTILLLLHPQNNYDLSDLNSSDCKGSNVVFSSTIIMSSCGAIWL